jgi:hypothetical protein
MFISCGFPFVMSRTDAQNGLDMSPDETMKGGLKYRAFYRIFYRIQLNVHYRH